MSYYDQHPVECNMNRMVHHYYKKLGKEYCKAIIKEKGKAEGLATLKIIAKLNRAIKKNSEILNGDIHTLHQLTTTFSNGSISNDFS